MIPFVAYKRSIKQQKWNRQTQKQKWSSKQKTRTPKLTRFSKSSDLPTKWKKKSTNIESSEKGSWYPPHQICGITFGYIQIKFWKVAVLALLCTIRALTTLNNLFKYQNIWSDVLFNNVGLKETTQTNEISFLGVDVQADLL